MIRVELELDAPDDVDPLQVAAWIGRTLASARALVATSWTVSRIDVTRDDE